MNIYSPYKIREKIADVDMKHAELSPVGSDGAHQVVFFL